MSKRFKRFCTIAFLLLFSCSLKAQTTLLHYWSFNKITSKATIPAPAIRADYSYLDTNRAVVQYDTIPGTPKAYVDSINTNSKSNGAYDNVAGDTLNARQGFIASNALRLRNPSWSSELRIYIPTTFYSNPIVKYALQSSSTTSGQHYQIFAYSIDSGKTWKTNGMTVNGVATDTLDCTQSPYQQATSFGLVTIGFVGDTNVNNNPKFVFRIRWAGQASTFSGNNRFDNLSVEAGPVPRTIVLQTPHFGDTLISGQRDTVTFTTTGKISQKTSVFYSLDSGMTWNALGTDTVTGFFTWMIPPVVNPVPFAMLAVVDSSGVKGYSRTFVILPQKYYPPDPSLIYYWHFNGLAGVFQYPNVRSIVPDFSAAPNASMVYALSSGSSISQAGQFQDATGTTLNTQMNYVAGRSLELDNPTNAIELRMYIPTVNRKNIAVHFALQTSNGYQGPLEALYDYSIDSGRTWKTASHKFDSIAKAPFTNGGWGYISVDLSSDLYASDNSHLVFRIRFSGNNGGSTGLVRLDNVTVTGEVGQVTIPGSITLLHYWNFNKLLAVYHNPGIPSLKADYSLLDTNAAHIDYTLEPGTSNTYLGYIDNVAGDTTNARNADAGGQALRVRNPSDSMELRMAIPTTGYKKIVLKYALESSSITSGQLAEHFDYSPDGGTTWSSAGLVVNGEDVDTLDVTQTQFQGTSWGLVTVAFSDPSTSNNPHLVFRIKFSGNTSKTSGNNRFDNVTVEGFPGVDYAASPLIHYWHFDSLNTAYHNPGIPNLPADFSVLTSGNPRIVYTLEPGTSTTYGGYIDNVAGDTLNERLGAIAGQALRVRNPSDSMELRFVIPTTGYHDIAFSYALESSSTTSGQLVEHFDYSPDGGTTWKSTALSVNGSNVDTLDVTQLQFQGTSWGLVSIGFGDDTTVNNNSNLIFRIKFSGNTSKTSGNNRFDNIAVEGTPLGVEQKPVPAAIVVSSPHAGDTLFSGSQVTISYSTAGPVESARSIDYSVDGGQTWTLIASNVTSTNFMWSVPAKGSTAAYVRVRDANGVVGLSSKFVILVTGHIERVYLLDPTPTVAEHTEIFWSGGGYLGSTVDIDASFDGKQTWTPIVHGYAFGTGSSYPWTLPSTPDTGVVIRVKFAEGTTAYSAPFNISLPLASVSVGSEAGRATLWPNPATNTISIENPANVTCDVTIVDASGREVLQVPNLSGVVFSVDISSLARGAYHFFVRDRNSVSSGTFVVIR